MRDRRPWLRLDPEAYRELCREVLERDGWRCQSCGRMEDLQVHHIKWRSRLGDDTAENLIALCNMPSKGPSINARSLPRPNK
jgi:5-methylcytosine-specific restriction endonuclease McrA